MGGNTGGGAMGPAGGGTMAPGNNNMGSGRQGSGPAPRNPGMQQIPPSGPMMRHQVRFKELKSNIFEIENIEYLLELSYFEILTDHQA